MDLLTYDLYYYRILQQLESLKKNKLELLRHKSSQLIRALPMLYDFQAQSRRVASPTEEHIIFFFVYIKHGRNIGFNLSKRKSNESPRRDMRKTATQISTTAAPAP